jgi:hypothetical protein
MVFAPAFLFWTFNLSDWVTTNPLPQGGTDFMPLR